MDLSTLTVVGLLVLLGIAWYASQRRKSSIEGQAKSKEQKRAELVDTYKLRMETALRPVTDDRELFLEKKRDLLKTFSIELSTNIFFDSDEVKEVIRELADFDVTA